MNALVIGGTRFIGLSAVHQLLDAGHEVTVFNRGETETAVPAEVQRIYGDLWSLEEKLPELQAVEADVVIHMMLLTGEQSRTTAEFLARVTPRLVVVSSGDVYRMFARINDTEPGPPDDVPVTEDGPLRDRRHPYSAVADGPDDWRSTYDKIEVEEAARAQAGLATTVVRLPMVYGPRDYQRRLWSYHKRMADGRPAILVDQRLTGWRASRCFVDDAGLAIATAATNPRAAGGTYNVAEFPAPTEMEWITMIAAAAGWEGRVVPVEPALLPDHLQLDPHGQDLYMDSARIRSELGFVEPVSRAQAITRTIEWDLENPPESHPDPFDYEAEDVILASLD